MSTTTALEVKNFDSPDEVRPFEGKGKADVVVVAGQTIGRGTFEPGWRWSENVKPIAGTDSCQVSHLGYVLSGRMRVFMNDGTEGTCSPRSSAERSSSTCSTRSSRRATRSGWPGSPLASSSRRRR